MNALLRAGYQDSEPMIPRGLAFAAPELFRTVLRQRARIVSAPDQRAALETLLADAVEVGVLTDRDVQRINAWLDSPEPGVVARQYHQESLVDWEASQLVGILFGAASLGGDVDASRNRVEVADVAALVAATMSMGSTLGAGVFIGIAAHHAYERVGLSSG